MTIFANEEAVSALAVSQAELAMDALVGRLSYDEDFASALSHSPRETLEQAGIILHKEAIEKFMKSDPDRFDKVCEALFGLVDSDFLHNLSDPSCA